MLPKHTRVCGPVGGQFIKTYTSNFCYFSNSARSAVVVAQLVERLLPKSEVCGLNPVIGKLLYQTFICLLSTVLKRRK